MPVEAREMSTVLGWSAPCKRLGLMAFESTAINDLIAGLQSRPVEQRDTNDWLFGEPEPADTDTSRHDKATAPFDRAAPVVPMQRSSSPTTHVRVTDWNGIAKKVTLPLGLFAVAMILLAVYLAKDESKPSKAASVTMTAKAEAIDLKPIEAPPPPPLPAAVAQPPIVTPIEDSPPQPTPDEPRAEPGSPASRFLATATTARPTIEAAAEKPAPAPTAVAGVRPTPEKLAAAEPESLGVAITAEPIAKAKPRKRAPSRAEQRAAAKRAASAIAAAKARSNRRVATTDDDGEKPAAKPRTGKGILQIASSPVMEVWVDGRNSNAQTPVRIILRPGKHKVTLLEKQTAKARSFDVEIKADETTKVVKKY
jgi:hypothetical protein